MQESIFNQLVCPICRANLIHDKEKNILVCIERKLAFKIINNIPVMLEEEAIKLTDKEIKTYG